LNFLDLKKEPDTRVLKTLPKGRRKGKTRSDEKKKQRKGKRTPKPCHHDTWKCRTDAHKYHDSNADSRTTPTRKRRG